MPLCSNLRRRRNIAESLEVDRGLLMAASLNLMERSKYKSCEEFDFSRCPVWIQIHNVPLEALCLENAITIGGYVGEVMLAEYPFYNGRPDSRKIWLSVRYEKLQSFCYNCGKLGHDNQNCNSERLMSLFDPDMPRFGAWLATNSCRSWEEVMVVVCKEWAEADYVRRRKDEALKKKSREDKEKHRSASPPPEDDLFFIRLHNPYMEGSVDRSAKGFDSKNLKDDVIVDGVSEQGTNIDKRRVRANELGTKKTGHCSMAYKDGFAMGTRDMPSHEILREHGGESSEDKTINSPPEQNPQAMAMVLYNGGVMNDMINQMDVLGLKRNAVEDWGPTEPKRRKLVGTATELNPDISVYAANLRKAKAKAKRYTRKKGRRDKENTPSEMEGHDAVMEEPGVVYNDNSVFTFKAGGSKRKKTTSDGDGGWPLTATGVP
ncbi:hypothetical protein K1719_033938 [Acacia pycnantha]|nr:hypothetical protein K1719_033938 [Acacia pycnantha]